jgi:FMN phosphatase YigB (HAD superfamily)
MTITLLLDLDDTLIRNDINQFLPAYLKMLSQHLDSIHPGDQMVRELLIATRGMITNQDAASTLEEVFDRAFYPALGTTKASLQNVLENFYANVYPGLAPLTRKQPAASALVDAAYQRGYQVAVATNPLFPATAIEQRLDWAGLPVEQYDYALVTNYSNMHFSKPNPAYYAEILAQLGWPSDPVVMVGNSLEDDILPASSLGIATYHYMENAPFTTTGEQSASGDLSGVLPWLQTLEAGCFELPRTSAALLPAQRATPAALSTLTRTIPDEAWAYSPAANEWSITEIIAHLRDVDREVNLPRLLRVVTEENPFLVGVNSDPWAVERGYAKQNGQDALRDFSAARAEILSLLGSLSEAGWQRSARHAIFGPSLLSDLVEIIFTHDRNHLQQIRENIQAYLLTSATQSTRNTI